jgi:hypothetical protein
MATLNVTNLQNIASGVTNVSLLADGTTTLVLNATGTNRLGGIRYNAGNLEVYTSGGVWASVGGGGGGTVTGVTGTAPIASSGGSAPAISIGLGLGTVVNGSNIAVSIPVASTPPGIGTGATQGLNGSMYWDDTLGQLFIRYINGGTPAWVAAAPPAGGVPAASLAEAAAGVTTVKYSSPATSVPKDAANMTGAAILPSGTDAQRAAIATPTVGMQRFNTDSGFEEVYTGATVGWSNFAYVSKPSPLSNIVIPSGAQSLQGQYVCNDFTITAGATLSSAFSGVLIVAYGDVVINASTWNFSASGPLGGASGITVGNILNSPGTGYGGGNGGPGIAYLPVAQLGGSGGESGTRTSGANPATYAQWGGNGGGYIIIRSYGNITCSGVVTFNAAGGAGNRNSAVSNGGGGGGSGGLVILQSDKTLTVPATVSIDVSGGAGAAGITYNAATSTGGGGGGGGWVILQSPNVVGTPTTNLAGGAAGTGTGTAVLGGAGGSYAGAGGAAGTVTANGFAGSSGILTNGGSPF